MKYEMEQLMRKGMESGVSDIHITVALPPMFRINGNLVSAGDQALLPADTKEILYPLLDDSHRQIFEEHGEVDFSYTIPQVGRFRVNIYRQRKSVCAAIRIIRVGIPTVEELGVPLSLKSIAMKNNGLFLVTGPTGSGKSTTLAAMVGEINNNRSGHIITIEDPIEYMHKHSRCMVNQREIGDDTGSFASALRASLREDPDVILVGEMRDLETISTAVTAAETGHFVLSTLHTISTAQTIDRIIDVFPPYQHQQIRTQLSLILQGILTQQLIPTADGRGRVVAVELLIANDAIRNLIREGKTQQIPSMLQTGIRNGMIPMDYSIAQLLKRNIINVQAAFAHCADPEMIKRYAQAVD